MDTLALAKSAYSWFDVPSTERTVADFQPYFDLMAEDVVFKGCWAEDSPVYGGWIKGKEVVMKLVWDDDQEALDGNDKERPTRFYIIGDSVAMQNRQCYRIKSTGEWVRGVESCTVLTFRDNLISKILCIEDLSIWNMLMQRP